MLTWKDEQFAVVVAMWLCLFCMLVGAAGTYIAYPKMHECVYRTTNKNVEVEYILPCEFY